MTRNDALPVTTFLARQQAWQHERQADLLRDDGWLSLVALFWLETGDQTLGSAPEHPLRLPDGPADLGRLQVDRQGQARLLLPDDSPVRVDGLACRDARLRADDQPCPSRIEAGPLILQLLRRGGRLALRVRDRRASAGRGFAGLDYFPADPAWRLIAHWQRLPGPVHLQRSAASERQEVEAHHQACFRWQGQNYRLLAQPHTGDGVLFVFADLSNACTTYPGGRFLYCPTPREGRVVLDFNRAINPPCAFSEHATCPLPPDANRLPLHIEAGERRVRWIAQP